MYILQYLSIDGYWYDQSGMTIDDLDVGMALFDSLALTRGAEWQSRHRIVRRVDEVVYPSTGKIDPAKELGA